MNDLEIQIPKNLVPGKRGASGLRFSQMSFEERLQLCTLMAGSTTIPKSLQNNPANVYFIGERGDRIGLSLTESISCVYVVNGVTALWGDIPLALCRVSEVWEEKEFDEWIEVAGQRVDKNFDNKALGLAFEAGKLVIAYCKVKRKDQAKASVSSYSIQDAVIQELDRKDTWKKSPRRMLQRRARGLALTDNFSDVLFGLYSQEQAEDAVQLEPVSDLALQSQPDTKGAEIVAQQAEQTTVEVAQQPATQAPPAQPAENELVAQAQQLEQMLISTDAGTTAFKGIWLSFKLPAAQFGHESGTLHVPQENLGFYVKMLQAAQAGLGKGKKK